MNTTTPIAADSVVEPAKPWRWPAWGMLAISIVVTAAGLSAYDCFVARPARRLGVVDLAAIVAGGIEHRAGQSAEAARDWAPVRSRLARGVAPSYVYRSELSTWQPIHVLPAFERDLLARLAR